MTRHFPLKGVRVDVEFHGSLRGNADADNGGGSWLDAMVKCGILSGDDVQKVNEVDFKFFDDGLQLSAIIIYPNWTPVSALDPSLLQASTFQTTVKLAKQATARRSRKTPVKTAAAKKPRLTIVKAPQK
jgi:hypothetical protein